MPRAKKTKVETPAETVAETVETPVKKTTTRKTAAKKTTAAASETKKTASKTASKAKPAAEVKVEAPAAKAEVFIEYGGAQVSVDEVIKNAKAVVGEDKDVKIYVKPDESKAYIAFDDQSVAMDVFFCE